LVFLGACKAYIAGLNFDRDSNLKIYLLPGLEAQKVEKHCTSGPNISIIDHEIHMVAAINELEKL